MYEKLSIETPQLHGTWGFLVLDCTHSNIPFTSSAYHCLRNCSSGQYLVVRSR